MLFAAFAVAFAVKVPLVPLHTWLPDAHVEAPTGGSVVLAGVTLKMGTYGLLRFALPLFPSATLEAASRCMHGPLGGGDPLRRPAGLGPARPQEAHCLLLHQPPRASWSSVMFALNVEGAGGSVLQMVNHGLSTGALFLLVGMIYERAHKRRPRRTSVAWRARCRGSRSSSWWPPSPPSACRA